MGTQILKGSKGYINVPVKGIDGKTVTVKTVPFTVTMDTCLQAYKLPVRFDDASEAIFIEMSKAVFIKGVSIKKDY